MGDFRNPNTAGRGRRFEKLARERAAEFVDEGRASTHEQAQELAQLKAEHWKCFEHLKVSKSYEVQRRSDELSAAISVAEKQVHELVGKLAEEREVFANLVMDGVRRRMAERLRNLHAP